MQRYAQDGVGDVDLNLGGHDRDGKVDNCDLEVCHVLQVFWV